MPELIENKILDLFSLVKQSGDVGVEIEIEGGDNPYPTPPVGWSVLSDGSLRGFSAEYVFKAPLPIKNVKSALDKLYSVISSSSATPKYSFRAGVHVHINCQELTLKQVRNFALLYYTFENVFTNWCGSDRVGNYFCLRATDAEEVLNRVAQILQQKKYTHTWLNKISSEDIRYAGLNWTSLPKFGSLEFRTLATDPTKMGFNKINTWAEVLIHLREKSKEFSSPEEMLERFSILSPENFSKDVLGEYHDLFKTDPSFKENMWVGIRTAQDLILFME